MADNMGTLDDRVGHQERAAQSRICLFWYLQCEPFFLFLTTLSQVSPHYVQSLPCCMSYSCVVDSHHILTAPMQC